MPILATPKHRVSKPRVTMPASQLLSKLETESIYDLELEDEDRSMHHFASVIADGGMNDIGSLRFLDLSPLESYEPPGQQTIPALFYAAAAERLSKLKCLTLGKACLNEANGPNLIGKFDVDYFVSSMPQWVRLRALYLPWLGLTAEHAGDILKACVNCPSLVHLDLSGNLLRNLEEVVSTEVVCRLGSLNLKMNAFGEEDDFAVTCMALDRLLQYTSLQNIDLSCNHFDNLHGPTVAEALENHTHLRELDLSDNHFEGSVAKSIRDAWSLDENAADEPWLLRR
jgi:Leucine-rich repeat (LRR) protein